MIWLLLACTSSNPGPAPMPEKTVADPRAYVIAGWAANDRNWLGMAYLNPTDAAVVDPILDKELKFERSFKGTLPHDAASLDRFIRKTQVKYDAGTKRTEEGRAAIERLLRERFENPEVTLEDGVATASLGFAPGKLVKGLRSGWVIETDPSLLDWGELVHEHVVRGFRTAHAAHPDARAWQVEVQLIRNVQRSRFTYQYTQGKDRLFLQADHKKRIGFEDLGGVEGLLKGDYPTYSLELDDATGEWQLLRPR